MASYLCSLTRESYSVVRISQSVCLSSGVFPPRQSQVPTSVSSAVLAIQTTMFRLWKQSKFKLLVSTFSYYNCNLPPMFAFESFFSVNFKEKSKLCSVFWSCLDYKTFVHKRKKNTQKVRGKKMEPWYIYWNSLSFFSYISNIEF